MIDSGQVSPCQPDMRKGDRVASGVGCVPNVFLTDMVTALRISQSRHMRQGEPCRVCAHAISSAKYFPVGYEQDFTDWVYRESQNGWME